MDMTPFWGILIPFILIAYIILLHRFIGKKRDVDKLMWAFGVIAIIGFVLHMILFNFITETCYYDFNDNLKIHICCTVFSGNVHW